VIGKASPTINTTPNPTVVLLVRCLMTVQPGWWSHPTGTITFNLYGVGDATCSAAAIFTNTVPVSGNGRTVPLPGSPRWRQAPITGSPPKRDVNKPVSGICADEAVVIG